jgi:hypothetical protein
MPYDPDATKHESLRRRPRWPALPFGVGGFFLTVALLVMLPLVFLLYCLVQNKTAAPATLTVDELTRDYAAYGGKRIRVRGQIDSVGPIVDSLGKTNTLNVTLNNRVLCYCDLSDEADFANSTGETVVIEGFVPEHRNENSGKYSIILRRCKRIYP